MRLCFTSVTGAYTTQRRSDGQTYGHIGTARAWAAYIRCTPSTRWLCIHVGSPVRRSVSTGVAQKTCTELSINRINACRWDYIFFHRIKCQQALHYAYHLVWNSCYVPDLIYDVKSRAWDAKMWYASNKVNDVSAHSCVCSPKTAMNCTL